MAVTLPYPYPDLTTQEWPAFALLRDLQFLAERTAQSNLDTLFRVTGNPYVTIESTAAETTAYSTTILGGTLETLHSIRVTIHGDVLNNTGSSRTFTLRLKYGGSTWGTLTPDLFITNATRRGWVMNGTITATGATNTQYASSFLSVANPGVSGTSNTGLEDVRSYHNSLTVDSTSMSQTFTVTVQPGVSSANLSVRLFLVLGELV